MKTKNNVQKAITKMVAAGISLVLISITVNAQDLWRALFENSSFNTIATAMVETDSETAKIEVSNLENADFTTFLEETEEPLELEPWMFGEGTFTSTLNNETEMETPLPLEDWMINENSFNTNIYIMEEESEEILELESWMTDDNNFGIPTFEIIQETEEPLELENWMLKDNLFKNFENKEEPLELESWMISERNWIV